MRYLYRPIDLGAIGKDASDVGELLRAGAMLGFNAFNITHPCKQLVLEHLDEISDEARAIGAVNTVVIRDGRFHGYNTDASGFAWALANGLPGAKLDTCCSWAWGAPVPPWPTRCWPPAPANCCWWTPNPPAPPNAQRP